MFSRTRNTFRVALVVVTTVALAAGLASCKPDPADTAACAALSAPIYHVVNPQTQQSLLTRWKSEANNAGVKYGFTEDHGVAFKAATAGSADLVAIHRLYNTTSGDFAWIQEGAETAQMVSESGYRDDGVGFYAATKTWSCTTPVHRLVKGSKHRIAATAADLDALIAAGWSDEGATYHAVPGTATPPTSTTTSPTSTTTSTTTPPDTDTEFGLAVMPDTQNETSGGTRFINRTQWLANNKAALDLRFVLHTGDVVNWGWLVPSQFAVASAAMVPLEQAAIPYALSVGNHDTSAVGWDGIVGSRGYGGSAYVGNPECVERLSAAQCNTNLLVRHTEAFNANFNAGRYTDVAGAFEAGKVDNIYSTFNAGGKKWLVLTLELWSRTEVVDWAKQVVASHSDANVIVQTHSYLAADGTISQSNGGYGSHSPQYLYDNLIKQYPNIKMVFSGHTGAAANRTDTGVNGNKIVSFLQSFHSPDTNPVRLLDIDTGTGLLTTRIYAPANDRSYPEYDVTVTGMTWVG